MFQAARRRLILPFLLPQIILYTGVTFTSIAATVGLSLTSWAGVNPPRFIGLRNYRQMLDDHAFQRTIGNTVYYVVLGGVLLVVFSMLLAWCLNEPISAKRFYRFLILAPAVISVSVAALMWKWIYNPLFGLVGSPLRLIGRALDYEPLLEGVLRNASTTLTAVIFTHLWHSLGVWVILLLAGLERLPPSLLEAARVDGANEWQVFFHVTLPLMWELLRVMIVLWIMTALQAFSYVYLMRSGGVIATYIYSKTFDQWNWAYGMSLATTVMAVIFVIVMFTNRLLQREVAEFNLGDRMADAIVARLLLQIDHDREEIIAFEQNLIRRPSETGHEKDCQDFLAGWLRRAGYAVEVFTPDEVAGGKDFRGRPLSTDYSQRPNVVTVHKGAGGGRTLLLMSHVDTVPVGPLENWTVPPYGGEIRDGKIYGRGAQDDKEGIVAQTYALECIRRLGLRLKGDVTLCSVVDEEGGGSMGSWACMARGYRADAGIYCDGLDLKVNPANLGWSGGRIHIQCPPGRMNTDVTKACADAVYNAVHTLRQERRAAFASRPLYRSTVWPDENIIVPYFSVGQAQGVAMNEATVMAFMYTLPGNTVHDDRRELEACVRQTWEALGVAAPPPVVEWSYTWPDPYQASGAEPLLETLRAASELAMGAPAVIEGGTASDLYMMGLYSDGMPSVCLGPGQFGVPEAAHQPDESISIDDRLIPFVKIIAVTMLNWCGWEA